MGDGTAAASGTGSRRGITNSQQQTVSSKQWSLLLTAFNE
jgi:hypothetical protein